MSIGVQWPEGVHGLNCQNCGNCRWEFVEELDDEVRYECMSCGGTTDLDKNDAVFDDE